MPESESISKSTGVPSNNEELPLPPLAQERLLRFRAELELAEMRVVLIRSQLEGFGAELSREIGGGKPLSISFERGSVKAFRRRNE